MMAWSLVGIVCACAQEQQERFRLVASDTTATVIKHATDTIHNSKVYIGSGSVGLGIPLGRSKEYLSTRLTGNWGIDISLPNRNMLFYPSIDYLSFDYNQIEDDPEYDYRVENGRVTFTNVNLPLGVRKQWKHLNTYVLVGPSVGLFHEPRTRIDSESLVAHTDYKSHIIFGSRMGFGADYKFKGFFVFADFGWLHSFKSIQDRPLNIATVYIGLKTDITRVADKVISTVFEKK